MRAGSHSSIELDLGYGLVRTIAQKTTPSTRSRRLLAVQKMQNTSGPVLPITCLCSADGRNGL